VVKHKSKHFAAALIRRTDPETGKRQLLIIHYHPVVIVDGQRIRRGRFHIKFPGGKQWFKDESPKKTVRRECIAEIGLIIRGAVEVCELPTELGPQHYFLAEFERCKGRLRTADDGVLEDTKSDLDPPVWVDEDLLENLPHPTHKKALLIYLESGL